MGFIPDSTRRSAAELRYNLELFAELARYPDEEAHLQALLDMALPPKIGEAWAHSLLTAVSTSSIDREARYHDLRVTGPPAPLAGTWRIDSKSLRRWHGYQIAFFGGLIDPNAQVDTATEERVWRMPLEAVNGKQAVNGKPLPPVVAFECWRRWAQYWPEGQEPHPLHVEIRWRPGDRTRESVHGWEQLPAGARAEDWHAAIQAVFQARALLRHVDRQWRGQRGGKRNYGSREALRKSMREVRERILNNDEFLDSRAIYRGLGMSKSAYYENLPLLGLTPEDVIEGRL